MRWVSIDPGEAHAGLTVWEDFTPVLSEAHTPDSCTDRFVELIPTLGLFVYEKYVLYGWKAHEQFGTEIPTIKHIGALEHVRRTMRPELPMYSYTAREHKRIYDMDWYKGLTLADKKRYPWYRKGPHTKDSWCVGRWHMWKRGHKDAR
jgi:hypothetical protein